MTFSLIESMKANLEHPNMFVWQICFLSKHTLKSLPNVGMYYFKFELNKGNLFSASVKPFNIAAVTAHFAPFMFTAAYVNP